MTHKKGSSLIRATALFALFYCILVWYLTEQATGWGEVIRQWRQEYYGDDGIPTGSMKFRTPAGRQFVSLSVPWGFLVYPTTVIAGVWYFRRAIAKQSIQRRLPFLIGVFIMVAILARFLWLGVFTSVTASF